MKTPGILEGTGVAIIASLGAGVLGALLPILVSNATSARIVVASLALAYLLFLLKRSEERSGRLVVLVAWLVISVMVWMLDTTLLWFVLSQALTIWIIRALYFHSSVLPALFDLGLVGLPDLLSDSSGSPTQSHNACNTVRNEEIEIALLREKQKRTAS